jgi:multidrug efflux pump subunit AcrA (membrane-fusion protein)
MSVRAPEMRHFRWAGLAAPRVFLFVGGGLGLILVAIVAVVLSHTVGLPPAAQPTATPAVATLMLRGSVQPVRMAHVGTIGGGVVQHLAVTLDAMVGDHTVVAWVTGPAGTEVITAPFDGSVTNVLVHEGDTVLPGSTLMVVSNTHQLQVESSDADEYAIARLTPGDTVDVVLDAIDGVAIPGTLTGLADTPQTNV